MDVDVVVVDDASTDDSLAVARALAAADPRVTVLAHERNQGPVATFNDGLALVTGDYLVRLDADDALTPGSLARAVAVAEAFPDVGMVYGHPRHFTGDVLPEPRTRLRGWTVWSGASWLAARCHEGVNCITSPEVLMRTSVVREVGGQRELAHTHDMEMWMRLARAADVARVDGPDQAFHRDHPASRSSVGVDVLVDLEERAEAYTVLFTDGRGDPDRDARLLAVARRALAEEAVSRVCQAYASGWGGDDTTDAYLAFARTQVADLGDLRSERRLRASLRGARPGRRAAPACCWRRPATGSARSSGRGCGRTPDCEPRAPASGPPSIGAGTQMNVASKPGQGRAHRPGRGPGRRHRPRGPCGGQALHRGPRAAPAAAGGRRGLPAGHRATPSPARPRGSALEIGWVLSPPAPGSGGHTTLFRFVEALERAGHRCVLYLYDTGSGSLADREAVIRRWWPGVRAEVRSVDDGLPDMDAWVATAWHTAHVLARRSGVRGRRFYLAQDYEPYFYGRGPSYELAEDTYRFGFRMITVGHMVADEVGERSASRRWSPRSAATRRSTG